MGILFLMSSVKSSWAKYQNVHQPTKFVCNLNQSGVSQPIGPFFTLTFIETHCDYNKGFVFSLNAWVWLHLRCFLRRTRQTAAVQSSPPIVEDCITLLLALLRLVLHVLWNTRTFASVFFWSKIFGFESSWPCPCVKRLPFSCSVGTSTLATSLQGERADLRPPGKSRSHRQFFRRQPLKMMATCSGQ